MNLFSGFAAVGLLFCFTNGLPHVPVDEKDRNYWHNIAKDYIDKKLHYKENNRIAKNVILFIGDGMGGSTVTASRILRGQINGRPGEETILKFEEFPHVALSKTYNVDRQTADSAGTATAIMSGVKTNFRLIGLDGSAQLDDCEGSKGKQVDSMLNWAIDAGKATGIISNARITHATPAAAYAHAASRYWEGDVDMKDVTGGCRDIAQQLIKENPRINVIMGGGRRYFLPNTTLDPETNKTDTYQRQDGLDLIQEWKDEKKDRGVGHEYAWNKDTFDAIDARYTDYVLGLFEPSHMAYELDRDKSGPTGEPSLSEMTRKAIQVLKKDFFLYIEGSHIDIAHHYGMTRKSLYETLELENAVRAAVELTDPEETLIIVTADHSHPFDIQGFSYRGNDILGLANPQFRPALDDKPYPSLMYTNGPGYIEGRENLTGVDLTGKDYAFPSGVPTVKSTHSGEDVAIYATGPMAHLFYGVHEQNYIAHVMAFSACVGPYHGRLCDRMTSEDETSAGTRTKIPQWILIFEMIYYLATTFS